VASVLCVGQPVRYKLKANTGITRDWLLTYVVPGISQQYEDDDANRITDVLYACLEPGCEYLLMPEVYGRVRAAWIILCVEHEHERDWNPVEKVVLQVHRYENQLVIDELIAIPGGGNNGGGGVGGDDDPLVLANRAAGNQQQLGIITNQLHQLKQGLTQAKMENLHAISELRSFCQHQFGNVHTTFGKLLQQAPTRRVPVNRPANATTAAAMVAATTVNATANVANASGGV
jgi:hypothetical protein